MQTDTCGGGGGGGDAIGDGGGETRGGEVARASDAGAAFCSASAKTCSSGEPTGMAIHWRPDSGASVWYVRPAATGRGGKSSPFGSGVLAIVGKPVEGLPARMSAMGGKTSASGGRAPAR